MAYIDKAYIESKSNTEDISSILSSNGIDNTELDNIITDAEATVNRKLSARYVTPIPTPTNDLKRIVLDITLYFIYSLSHNDKEMEAVYNRYLLALKTLDNIANGKESLSGATEIAEPTSRAIIVAKSRTQKYTSEYLDTM